MMQPPAPATHLMLALTVLLSPGCKQEPASPAAKPPRAAVVSSTPHPVGAPELDEARQALVLALKKASALHPERRVAHLSHVCSLELGERRYPVIDLRELVPSATAPRGVNAILVLDSNLSLVQRIEYTTERPLFCAENRLYVWGDLRIDELSAEGNELTFDSNGRVASLQQVEAADIPAWTP